MHTTGWQAIGLKIPYFKATQYEEIVLIRSIPSFVGMSQIRVGTLGRRRIPEVVPPSRACRIEDDDICQEGEMGYACESDVALAAVVLHCGTER